MSVIGLAARGRPRHPMAGHARPCTERRRTTWRPSGPGWSTRAGARSSSRSRTPTGSGPAARASRRRTPEESRGSRGRPRCTRCRPCSSSGSTRRRSPPAGRSRSSRRTDAGSTTGSATSTARSSRASTAGRSRPARTSGWTWRRSSSGSSASGWRTAAGTARPRTARCGPPSTRRSTCSTACSSSNERRAGRRRCARPGAAARSTSSNGACSAARAPRRSSTRRTSSFAFPYYWHYDVLRALDYFRRSGADPDPRMAEAVAVVRSKRQPDGRWLLDRIHPGRVHFDLEGGVGTPSRWNTAPRAPGARVVGPDGLTRSRVV